MWIDVIHRMNDGDPEFPPTKEELNEKEVDFDTFLKILAEVSAMPSTGTAADFTEGMKVFDKDGNGFVLAVEIQHILSSLGENLSQAEVKRSLRMLKPTLLV